MTHPPGWTADEPCPSCGSWDITEYEICIGTDKIQMGWECRDCRHAATWQGRPEGHANQAVTATGPEGG
jgi:hypothetical protein